ncbi:MAG: GDP-mannose 4,6-dehydratase [Candidatus Altiarchaeota archaeon]|nr:GDP-mannose 4,6-dehydratase [Candidatus Altiarchaeota archaeon]
MRILVTGGAGFIGSHLCERLLSEGHNVVCVDNFDPFYPRESKEGNIAGLLGDGNFTMHEADVRDAVMDNIVSEAKPDVIVHLAAKAGVRPSLSNPREYADVNVNGTLNILESMRRNNVRRIVFGSSSSVYGNASKVPFSEDDALAPISPYAASKLAGELYCRMYSQLYGIKASCLRFFTVYGPRGRPDMAPYKFTKLVNEGKEIEMYGDGSARRDYTFISDIVDGIMLALEKEFEFEIFNLGESKTTTLKDFISIIERNLGRKAKIKQVPAQMGDVNVTYADTSKSRKLLGYNPKVPVEDGMKEFVNWFKNRKP